MRTIILATTVALSIACNGGPDTHSDIVIGDAAVDAAADAGPTPACPTDPCGLVTCDDAGVPTTMWWQQGTLCSSGPIVGSCVVFDGGHECLPCGQDGQPCCHPDESRPETWLCGNRGLNWQCPADGGC